MQQSCQLSPFLADHGNLLLSLIFNNPVIEVTCYHCSSLLLIAIGLIVDACAAGTLVHHTIGWWDVKLNNPYKGCSHYRVGETLVSLYCPLSILVSLYCP